MADRQYRAEVTVWMTLDEAANPFVVLEGIAPPAGVTHITVGTVYQEGGPDSQLSPPLRAPLDQAPVEP